ncbi:hypothetical protein ACOME3_009332 [Neoechinorhynchus agilis]
MQQVLKLWITWNRITVKLFYYYYYCDCGIGVSLFIRFQFCVIRWELISREIIRPRHRAMECGAIDQSREPFGIQRKDFHGLNYIKHPFEIRRLKENSFMRYFNPLTVFCGLL